MNTPHRKLIGQAALPRCGLGFVLILLAGITAAGTMPKAPDNGPAHPYVLENGVTAPIYDYASAIRESVWVYTPDLDGDGAADKPGIIALQTVWRFVERYGARLMPRSMSGGGGRSHR